MKRILNNVNQNLSKILNVDEKKLEYHLNKLEENLIYNSKKDIEICLDIKIKKKYCINENDFEVSRNVMEYFSEFGIDFFFEVDCDIKNNNCSIF